MHIIRMLLYENGELSLTRVLAVVGWLAFLSVSFYLVYEHQTMYYEVTYNGDKKEVYLDAYKKFENRCIKES